MRNFYKLAEGVNTTPVLDAIVRNQDDLWNAYNFPKFSAEVDYILLRFQEKNDDTLESNSYPAWFMLSQVQSIIFDLMRRVEGVRLGRVMITRLAPGKVISPREDEDLCAMYYDPYYVVLKNNPGSLFRCGDETVTMKTGEVWHFDNKMECETVNNSADDCIILSIDIKSTRG